MGGVSRVSVTIGASFSFIVEYLVNRFPYYLPELHSPNAASQRTDTCYNQ